MNVQEDFKPFIKSLQQTLISEALVVQLIYFLFLRTIDMNMYSETKWYMLGKS